jgi:hypothetical protein
MGQLEIKKPEGKKLEIPDLVRSAQDFEERHDNDLLSLLAISELLDVKKIKTISRIKPEQTGNIAKLYLFADTFKTPFTRSLADTILQLQISINGLGRKELVQLVQKRVNEMMETRTVTSKDIFR